MPTSSCLPRLDPDDRLRGTLGALQRQGVPGAGRAARTLARLLAGYGREQRAWARSTLTADGFPCELTFGSGAPCVRYAVEPAAASARLRRAACESLLARAGVPALPAVLRHRIDALQEGATLAYGAWIGASHDGAEDRYKLYVEVPVDGAEGAARAMLTDYLGHAAPHRRYRLRMVGCDPLTGTLELYFRSEEGLPPHLTPSLLARLAGRQPAGFSLALGADGRLAATSRYVFANQALGADPQLRRRVLRHAARHGWHLSGYAAASAPTAAGAEARHGLLAWITRFNGPGEVRLGLSPPRHPAHPFAANPSIKE